MRDQIKLLRKKSEAMYKNFEQLQKSRKKYLSECYGYVQPEIWEN